MSLIGSAFIVDVITQYQLAAVFTGAFLFGESVIATAAYLAAQLHWSMTLVAAAAFFGTVISDSLWFLLGRRLQRWLEQKKLLQKQREQAAELLEKLAGTRPFVALLFIKFLYGSRIAMILYVAARGMAFTTFFAFNAMGTLLWLGVVMGLGYAAGQGVGSLPPTDAVQFGIFVLIIAFIVFRLLGIWLSKNLPRK